MDQLDNNFDAVVIGAGVGGMCAAVRLAHAGYRTLVVEALDRIGGRASTREVNGFLLNTGALVIEIDGAVEQTMREVGLEPVELFVPKPATVLRWGSRDFNADRGLVGRGRSLGPAALNALAKRMSRFEPREGESLRTWLTRVTRNKTIHELVDHVVGAMFAATLDDLPADVFLHYFATGSQFKRIGFAPGGTIEVWKPMARFVEDKGGAVWVSTVARELTFDDNGNVDGVVIERAGERLRVGTRAVVSNVGPLATARLAGAGNLPVGYVEDVEAKTDGAAIITVHFASQKPLAKFPGLALVGKSRRLVYAGNFSAPEQKRAPEGWYLYCGASVPRPARGEFDIRQEKKLLFDDLRDYFPGFDESMILAIDVTAHEWPAQRAITGYDLPIETPVHNLWNVGDGVKPWGQAGTAACAESARHAVAQLVERVPLGLGATSPNGRRR